MLVTAFAAKYPPEGPFIAAANADQERLLGEADGVIQLLSAPFPEPVPSLPGQSDGRHLWVFGDADVRAILETAPRAQPPLASGVAKHTNLTGGRPASCAGELWVDNVSSDRLYVNGKSGRYWRPNHANGRLRLADAVRVFEGLGYQVVSAGWDEDNDRPAATFREL